MLRFFGKAALTVLMLSSVLAPAATVADDPRVVQLEQKVQALEKRFRDLESLLMEFADEIALLNVKVMELEKRLGVPVK